MATNTAAPETQSASTPRLIWLLFGGAGLLYGLPSIWLLMSYLQAPFDLAIYDQALWLIAHGKSFITVAGIDVNSAHFSPILFLISPVAFVPGGAVPELVLQAIMIASGVFPAYRLGKSMNQDGRWFAMAYAIHPAIIGGSWFGWRPWNIAVPVFMWLIWWIYCKPRVITIGIAGLIMLAFREDLAVWIGLVTLILFLSKKIPWSTLWKSGLVLEGATALVVLAVLPAISAVDGYFFTSSSQVVDGVRTVMIASVVTRLVFLLGPLALLPRRFNWLLMAPLAIPIVGLLIRGGTSLTTFYHYDMMFVPALLLIAGLSTSVQYKPGVLVIASLLVLVGLGALRPFPPQAGGNPLRYNAANVAEFNEARRTLDNDPNVGAASMSLHGALVPHYSERSNIFIHPFPVDVWRDSNGNEAPLTIDFHCPEPSLLVASPSLLTQPWVQAIERSYTRSDFGNGQLALWSRSPQPPSNPCSATLGARD